MKAQLVRRRAKHFLLWSAVVVVLVPSRHADLHTQNPAIADCPIKITGDVNASGSLSASDVIALFNYVYRRGPAPKPIAEAGDVTCNGVIDISDILTLVYYIFRTGASICDACTVLPPVPGASFYSFENDLQGWERRRADIELFPDTINWSIERSQDTARHGTTSLKFFLENWNDAGKIWIERVFAVTPGQPYHVQLGYGFASADFGRVNTWRIIAGVLPERPQTGADLTPAFQGDTWNGIDSIVDNYYVWLDKNYEFDLAAGPQGLLFVVIGVWGVWETPRTYYVDSVTVTFADGAR